MNKPNFIKTVPPEQQKALAWWFYSSITMVSIVVTSIVIVQIKRLMVLTHEKQLYLTLEQETQDFDALVKRKQNLKQDISTINSKIDPIKKIEQKNKQILEVLELIKKHISAPSLEGFEVNETNFNITFKTDQIQTLEHLIQTLKQSKSLKEVYLDSLHQNVDKIFLVTLKGVL